MHRSCSTSRPAAPSIVPCIAGAPPPTELELGDLIALLPFAAGAH